MSKEIPKVFHNTINKKINNNKDVYYSANKNEIENNTPKITNNHLKNTKSIKQKINQIFSSPNYVYKANVLITTKNETLKKNIIGRNNKYLITMDNETIPIEDILNIEFE